MRSPDGFVMAFAALATELRAQPDEHSIAARLMDHALRLTGCQCAAVGLVRGRGTVETIASSAEAERLHRLQHELAEGPAVDALLSRDICVAAVGSGARWRHWESIAAEAGVRGVVSVYMAVPGLVIGTVDLYSAGKPWGQNDVARALGIHGAIALATVRNETGLRAAFVTRTVIGQAEGILMERYGLDANSAFQFLRRYSQHHNVKLRVVAEALVKTGRLPAQDARGELGRLIG